ncbi:PEGA domain-containing protein [Stigmatella erecta]|uniref:PEGA domain-containing protein n=1 Tax=Stigmatella erecta TaxID=83460 RepID=A0A1I0LCJ8_9BACT|nr:PEGA domain-containing protein [Stigmatella erecta]SEU37849.1 PEGA domain-containing protein [Stigmatella erecta]
MTRLVLCLLLLLGATAGAQGSARRVAVVPLQALSGDLTSRGGPRLTERLMSELRGTGGLRLITPPPEEPPPDQLAPARAQVKEAEARRQQRDFAGAESALAQALEGYTTQAASLPHGQELADAHALRAAILYAQGKDEEATRAVTSALALAPGRALPLAATSPLFAHTVGRVQAALREQPRGSLRFTSAPTGVTVTLDGKRLESAPVRVAGVPPGLHLWRAELPSGEVAGGLVEVSSGQEAAVAIRPPGEGPSAVLAAALAGNRLDTAAVDAAAELGRSLGVDLLVFGTVSRTEEGLALDSFVLAPDTRAPRRLPRVTLDAELLDAGPRLRSLTGALAAQGAASGEAVRLPTAPAAQEAPDTRLLQVTYPEVAPPPAPATPTAPAPSRAPLTPRKPLIRP